MGSRDLAMGPEGSGGRAVARAEISWNAYVEGVVKAVAGQLVSAASAPEIVLSGRLARLPRLVEELSTRLRAVAPRAEIRGPTAEGWAAASPVKEAAVGAALLADGLCGGEHAPLVEALQLREASGSVLDHLVLPVALEGAERFTSLVASR